MKPKENSSATTKGGMMMARMARVEPYNDKKM